MNKRKKPISQRPLMRIIVIAVFEIIGIYFMAFILKGFEISGLESAIAVVIVLGFLNALLWPILSKIILPFAVLTGGLLFLVLNGFILLLASDFIEGIYIDTLITASIASLGITAVNVALSTLFTIDDDASYYRNVIAKRIKKNKGSVKTSVHGVFFLEIDGLSLPTLKKAMEQGYLPTLKRWLNNQTHQLTAWETDLSSQTGSSQAGLLHGNNFDMPAFRWYDRKLKKIMVSSNPDDVAYIEKIHSDKHGLLVNDGVSRGNLLSGDAPNVMNTASTITDLSRFHSQDFYTYFSNPYSFSRTILLFIWDIVLDRYRFFQQRRKNILPRLDKKHRNFRYSLIRAITTIFIRELNIYTLMGDMFAGKPSAYATFVGYDEVAHHSGVESKDAFDTLFKIDQQFARLENAAQDALRPYHFVILSDHGQSIGATFKQRFGKTLEELIKTFVQDIYVQGVISTEEGVTNLNTFLTDSMAQEHGKNIKKITKKIKNITVEEKLKIEQEINQQFVTDKKNKNATARIIVMASGNLGLIYDTRQEERLTLEKIESYLPGLLQGLASHPGIGFVMIKSEQHGPVVVGDKGTIYLESNEIIGENPLKNFGTNAAKHLLRTYSFPNCPDLLVNSFYDTQTDQVAAFEELIGSHGGLGGNQTQPFLLHPQELKISRTEPLVGAETVHYVMKNWVDTQK